MSETLERTFATLSAAVTGESRSGWAHSQGFVNFFTILGRIKSKYEEDQFIEKELSLQKQKLSKPGLPKAQIRESLVRLLYCHMLGHNVGLGHIHAVKLAQQGSLIEKRVGYLACSLFLTDNEDFLVLVVNTIQKDLQSTNVLENLMALTSLTYLLTTEMIPALLPLVQDKLRHSKEIVRKKAVLALHYFHQRAPEMVQHMESHVKQALCDPDPGVMWAALLVYKQMIKCGSVTDPDVARSLIHILQQVVNRKLPPDYEYLSVPAPWLTIQLLKTLAQLCAADDRHTGALYSVLADILQRTDPAVNVGLAVIYECLETIALVQPNSKLFEHAARCVGKFVTAKSNNLRYLGLKALTSLVEVSPHYALEHQDAVIECLEDADHTIRTKTLDLLFKISHERNVEVICDRMMEHLQKSHDQFLKDELASKISELTHKYQCDLRLYVARMNQLLGVLGDAAPASIINSITTHIQAGLPADQDNGHWIIQPYISALQQVSCTESLKAVAVWVLGCYGNKSTDPPPGDLINQLLCTYSGTTAVSTQRLTLGALCKLSDHIQDTSIVIEELRANLLENDFLLKQQLQDITGVLMSAQLKKIKHRSPSNIKQLDPFLSFLDEYTCEYLENGGQPYKCASLRHTQHHIKESSSIFSGLNFSPYEGPTARVPSSNGSVPSTDRDKLSAPSAVSVGSGSAKDEESGIKLKVKHKVWSLSGLVKDEDQRTMTSQDETQDPESQNGSTMESSAKPKTEVNRKKALASALFGDIVKEVNPDEAILSNDKLSSQSLSVTAESVSSGSEATIGQAASVSEDAGLFSQQLVSLEMDSSAAQGIQYKNPDKAYMMQEFLDIQSMNDAVDGYVEIKAQNLLTDPGAVSLSKELPDLINKDMSRTLQYSDLDEQSVQTDSLEDLSNCITDMYECSPLPPAVVAVLPRNLQSYPHEQELRLLSSAGVVNVYCAKVWRPEAVVLLFVVKCVTASPSRLHQTHTKITCSTDNQNVIMKKGLEASSLCTVEKYGDLIEGIVLSTDLTCIKPCKSSSVKIQVTAQGIQQDHNSSISVSLLDFVRPCDISVKEFVSCWQKFDHHHQCQLNMAGVTVQQLTSHLATFCRCVQVTGAEALLCCELPGCSCRLLLHIQNLSSAALKIWVKSSLPEAASELVGSVKDHLLASR